MALRIAATLAAIDLLAQPLGQGRGLADYLVSFVGKRLLAALRADALAVFEGGYRQGQADEAEQEEQRDPDGNPVVIVVALAQKLAPLVVAAQKILADSLYALQHALAVVPLAHGGDHVALLQAVADGVGQDALDAIARFEHDGALLRLGDELNQQSVVASLLAQPPMLEEVGGKLAGVVVANALDGHHRHLYAEAVFQQVEPLVDACHVGLAQDAVGVAHVVRPVAEPDVGDGLHRVVRGRP